LLDGAKRILIVNGPPGSGKSYTAAVIECVLERHGGRMAYVRLESELDWSQYTPNKIATDLLGRMGASVSLPEPEATRGFVSTLAETLVLAAANSGSHWWWVLDGFGHPELPRDTHDLVMRLVTRIAEPGSPPLRLVLLDYPSALPAGSEYWVETETLQVLTADDIRQHFAVIVDQEGLQIDAPTLHEIVNIVMQDLPEDTSRLRVMAERVSEIRRKLVA
jgi:hypothetical protein